MKDSKQTIHKRANPNSKIIEINNRQGNANLCNNKISLYSITCQKVFKLKHQVTRDGVKTMGYSKKGNILHC